MSLFWCFSCFSTLRFRGRYIPISQKLAGNVAFMSVSGIINVHFRQNSHPIGSELSGISEIQTSKPTSFDNFSEFLKNGSVSGLGISGISRGIPEMSQKVKWTRFRPFLEFDRKYTEILRKGSSKVATRNDRCQETGRKGT